MKCNKCAKEYSDEFAFCPYCGTKKHTEVSPNKVPLMFVYPVLTDTQLEALAAGLQGKSGAEIRAVFEGGKYSADVYAIRGELYRDALKKWDLWELSKSTWWLEEENKKYSNVRFFIEKRAFTKTMYRLVDRSVFRTEEEAIRAIKKAGYGRKDGGCWYLGGTNG